ncbi:MAG: cell division protein FtsA [Verrucomicrobiota bacterium]|nr:cell division protein FtsA [Verrucomicrobiota bacterium]MED5470665.1 cell division protein FtsA [Verrucomicrobiota bacterium]MEE2968298.1 cell division protein FtsA [Verrucomicrobiota bacterium]
MAKSKIYAGLEIGTSKICVVVGEVDSDGSIKILGIGQAPARGVRKGEIVDFETAQTCLHDALVQAEEKTDVMIGNVYLAITGAHIESLCNRGSIRVPDGPVANEITEEDLDEVRELARDVSLPQQNVFLHSIIRDYCVDGQEKVQQPVGMLGKVVEADYHIIHGIKTRMQNTIRCVREIPIQVDEVVFSPIAAAQVMLSKEQKERGALLIDIGGGTTDYVMYLGGSVAQSGCIAVGGDHITNDISMVMNVPLTRAERLKIEHGSVMVQDDEQEEFIMLEDDPHFSGLEIDKIMLNKIINARVSETFEQLRDRISKNDDINALGAGVFLTGGSSKLKEIDKLAEEIFSLPVSLASISTMSGATAPFENPQLATPMGLIRYAQMIEANKTERTNPFELFKKKLGGLFGGSSLTENNN